VARDRAVDAALRAAGWRVLRAWEHEPVADIADRINAALEGRSAGSQSAGV
jgi:DNA mismatch endonuclease (patch repair protein)